MGYVVVYGDVLTNESMKPSHLKRHLTTEHAVLTDKPVHFSCRIEAVKVYDSIVGDNIIAHLVSLKQ